MIKLIINEETGTVYGYLYTVYRLTETLYDQFEREDYNRRERVYFYYRRTQSTVHRVHSTGAAKHRENVEIVQEPANENQGPCQGGNGRA